MIEQPVPIYQFLDCLPEVVDAGVSESPLEKGQGPLAVVAHYILDFDPVRLEHPDDCPDPVAGFDLVVEVSPVHPALPVSLFDDGHKLRA